MVGKESLKWLGRPAHGFHDRLGHDLLSNVAPRWHVPGQDLSQAWNGRPAHGLHDRPGHDLPTNVAPGLHVPGLRDPANLSLKLAPLPRLQNALERRK